MEYQQRLELFNQAQNPTSTLNTKPNTFCKNPGEALSVTTKCLFLRWARALCMPCSLSFNKATGVAGTLFCAWLKNFCVAFSSLWILHSSLHASAALVRAKSASRCAANTLALQQYLLNVYPYKLRTGKQWLQAQSQEMVAATYLASTNCSSISAEFLVLPMLASTAASLFFASVNSDIRSAFSACNR